MKKSSMIALALGVSALLTSGCYTMVNSPYASSREREPEYISSRTDQRPAGDSRSSALGRPGSRDRTGSYPGYGYGGSGGSSIFGYNSNSGLYGFGSGYDSYPYSSAYGPNGYGFDPYYQGDTGLYIPPGYELVTTQELEQLRLNNSGVLTDTDPIVDLPTPAEVNALQDKQLEEDRYIWAERGTRSRSVPTGISRSSAGSRSSGSSSVSAKPAAKSDKSAKSSTKSSSSGKRAPKKRRR